MTNGFVIAKSGFFRKAFLFKGGRAGLIETAFQRQDSGR
jgi:hypothetical protein